MGILYTRIFGWVCMMFFCKNLLKLSAVLLFLTSFVCVMEGCADHEEPEIMRPSRDTWYRMYPNDGIVGDSVDAHLSLGVILVVFPNADFTLSFDADTENGAPLLRLFRLVKTEKGLLPKYMRSVKANLKDGRYEYPFICEENDKAEWAIVLEKDGDYYRGTTKNARLTGDGFYSDHLSLNLVLVGNVAKQFKGFTEEELASAMLARFRTFYKKIVIDTLYVNHAENHPVNGSLYPANEPWVAGRLDTDTMMVKLGGNWPGAENALDLVLVHSIDEIGLMGFSYLFSGNLGADTNSTVVLGANVRTDKKTLSNSMEAIVATAVHESGHFFGLRHTTSTFADMRGSRDYSVLEDGLMDTPFCRDLLFSGVAKKKAGEEIQSDMKISRPLGRILAAALNFDISSCPDVNNLMFPVETGADYDSLSSMQQELVRKTLMLYPH